MGIPLSKRDLLEKQALACEAERTVLEAATMNGETISREERIERTAREMGILSERLSEVRLAELIEEVMGVSATQRARQYSDYLIAAARPLAKNTRLRRVPPVPAEHQAEPEPQQAAALPEQEPPLLANAHTENTQEEDALQAPQAQKNEAEGSTVEQEPETAATQPAAPVSVSEGEGARGSKLTAEEEQEGISRVIALLREPGIAAKGDRLARKPLRDLLKLYQQRSKASLKTIAAYMPEGADYNARAIESRLNRPTAALEPDFVDALLMAIAIARSPNPGRKKLPQPSPGPGRGIRTSVIITPEDIEEVHGKLIAALSAPGIAQEGDDHMGSTPHSLFRLYHARCNISAGRIADDLPEPYNKQWLENRVARESSILRPEFIDVYLETVARIRAEMSAGQEELAPARRTRLRVGQSRSEARTMRRRPSSKVDEQESWVDRTGPDAGHHEREC